jgi:hypothetical protein
LPCATEIGLNGRIIFITFPAGLGNRRMTEARNINVYFSCPSCGAVYSATQRRKPGIIGRFTCKLCRKTVHRWWGTHYSFKDWKGPLYRAKDPAH